MHTFNPEEPLDVAWLTMFASMSMKNLLLLLTLTLFPACVDETNSDWGATGDHLNDVVVAISSQDMRCQTCDNALTQDDVEHSTVTYAVQQHIIIDVSGGGYSLTCQDYDDGSWNCFLHTPAVSVICEYDANGNQHCTVADQE